jgi:copper(I)-binding protein
MLNSFVRLVCACLMIVGVAPALAGDISAEDGWARARIPTARAGAAYVTVTNTGHHADTIVGASSPIAEVAELHTHTHENGIMKMSHVPAVPVPAGESVLFAPGGLHIMLIGLKQPMPEGGQFPVTLKFEHSPDITVSVSIKSIAAQTSGHGRHSGDGGSDSGDLDRGTMNHDKTGKPVTDSGLKMGTGHGAGSKHK